MDDVNHGLQYPDTSFDFVNGRFLAGGITDFPATIREIYRILAGTGTSWVQLTELRPFLRCDDRSIPPTALSLTWHNIFFTNTSIGNTLGTNAFDSIATNLRSWVTEAGFVDVREYIEKAPVGIWNPGTSLSPPFFEH